LLSLLAAPSSSTGPKPLDPERPPFDPELGGGKVTLAFAGGGVVELSAF